MSSVTDVSEFKSAQDFSKIIAGSSSCTPLDPASLLAIWSTLSLLNLNGPGQLGFLASHTALVPNPHGEAIPREAQRFLDDLTRAAHVTGASLACSSVLAGLSSESDAYGDVGLWLGHVALGEDRPARVVGLLGLERWLREGGKIVRLDSSQDALPSGLAQVPEAQRAAAQSHVNTLTSLISKLEERFEFRIEGGQGQGGNVIWILLGKLTLDKEQAWVGLVGAGTWAGNDE